MYEKKVREKIRIIKFGYFYEQTRQMYLRLFSNLCLPMFKHFLHAISVVSYDLSLKHESLRRGRTSATGLRPHPTNLLLWETPAMVGQRLPRSAAMPTDMFYIKDTRLLFSWRRRVKTPMCWYFPSRYVTQGVEIIPEPSNTSHLISHLLLRHVTSCIRDVFIISTRIHRPSKRK